MEKTSEFAKMSKGKQVGFTLIEVLLVVAIIGFITGSLAYSFKVLPRMKLKESSRKFSSACRFVSTLARTNHLYHRIVLDLDASNPQLVVEVLPPGSPIPMTDPEILDEEDDANLLFEDWPRFDPKNPLGEVGAADVGKPFMTAEPKWIAPKTRLKTKAKLEGIRITKVSFPCLNKEFETGKVGIIFSPDGSNPGVIIHMKSSGNPETTLLLNPGTSIVKFLQSDEIPPNICVDDDGNAVENEDSEDN
jgi:prepilin-type N-terminal cleavage/methylation domain-containing protein